MERGAVASSSPAGVVEAKAEANIGGRKKKRKFGKKWSNGTDMQ